MSWKSSFGNGIPYSVENKKMHICMETRSINTYAYINHVSLHSNIHQSYQSNLVLSIPTCYNNILKVQYSKIPNYHESLSSASLLPSHCSLTGFGDSYGCTLMSQHSTWNAPLHYLPKEASSSAIPCLLQWRQVRRQVLQQQPISEGCMWVFYHLKSIIIIRAGPDFRRHFSPPELWCVHKDAAPLRRPPWLFEVLVSTRIILFENFKLIHII